MARPGAVHRGLSNGRAQPAARASPLDVHRRDPALWKLRSNPARTGDHTRSTQPERAGDGQDEQYPLVPRRRPLDLSDDDRGAHLLRARFRGYGAGQVAYGALLSDSIERACAMTKTAPVAETLTTLPSGQANDPAIVYRERAIGYADLESKIARTAAGLARLGLARGDRLAVWLPNVPAWLVLFLAAARLGLLVVAVNTRFRAHEIADILGRSGAKALALWPGFKGIDFAGILADVPAGVRSALGAVIVYDEREPVPESVAGCRTVRYSGLEDGPPLDGAAAIDASTPSILFTTSGTTRAPKFVLHTHGSITA